jgi:antibiotic biosynthesis monooxygenase (ABM) superfamily enzyme
MKNGVIAGYPIEDVRVELVLVLIMTLILLRWLLKLLDLWLYKKHVKKLPGSYGANDER